VGGIVMLNPKELLWKASYNFFDQMVQRARMLFDIARHVAAGGGYLRSRGPGL
jgi:hypothetical protein